ncbi:MAG: SUF system Fe-S cluster assembly regulator [Gammaproteobacteria bacterium]
MLRMSKMTDYGTMVLAHIAAEPGRIFAASEIAAETKLALPTVRKLLKMLSKAELVASYRGASGGYALSRPAEDISAAEILDALEGPVTLTECSASDSQCRLEHSCGVGQSWQHINRLIRQSLEDVSLTQLCNEHTLTVQFSLGDGLAVRPATS